MIVSRPINKRQAHKSAYILSSLLLPLLLGALCWAQVQDGEDQFQAYHHDIGRISGSQSGALVAPETIVRQAEVQPVVVPARIREPAVHQHRQPLPVASHQQRSSHLIQAVQPAAVVAVPVQAQLPVRKSNRVTLAVRQHAGHADSLLEASPAPVPVQIVQPALAPPVQHQQAASIAPATVVAAEPNYANLMAQVAAERQASIQRSRHHAIDHNPSIGSPLEALPSPSFAPQPPVAPVVAPGPLIQVSAPQVQQQPPYLAAASSQYGNQAEEQIEVPSFEHVLGHGCPHKGVFSWENKDHCDRYYMCTNGTFTEEACPNGLAYSQMGAVYQHCAYNWNVNCGNKKTAGPLASPGCPWQFGIFPTSQAGQCSIDYFVCEWGVPETKRCHPEGLFYDDRIKGCQWADQLGCKSEALLNFKCPAEDEDNPFWPYPRYYHNKQDIIVCVNEQPRLVHCTEDQIVDPNSLSCLDLKKNKKKF